MRIVPYIGELKSYLSPSDTIDFNHAQICKIATEIASHSKDNIDYIKVAYEYVRDYISHSSDINNDTVTCKASEVLEAGHGICFAKSHLLAALLRCQSIPTGFCYQRLILDDDTAPYLVLHGLNGVYIKEYKKWIRLDARGNKLGVEAQFSIDEEKLAFSVRPQKGEEDIPIVYPVPDQSVIEALMKNKTRTALWNNLPSELSLDKSNKEVYKCNQ